MPIRAGTGLALGVAELKMTDELELPSTDALEALDTDSEALGGVEVDELDDALLAIGLVSFFWYMLNRAGPPQYWLAFAAQGIVHDPVDGADPVVITSPQ